MNCIDIDSHNLCLLNFFDILGNCENEISNDLHQYELLDNLSYQNIDTKKILYYHIILHICETFIHKLTFNKVILVYNEMDLTKSLLVKYSNKQRTLSFLTNTLNKIGNILPIKLYKSNVMFNTMRDILDNDDGERIELISELQQVTNKVDSFQKVKKFAQKYELTFLSREFFRRVKTKNLMFS
jgi:hypothetical protein